MPGLAEEPLYGMEPDAETGAVANDSIWDELITEAGDVAIAGMQWLSGQEITTGDPVTIYSNEPSSTTSDLTWLWWTLGGLLLLIIIYLIVRNR